MWQELKDCFLIGTSFLCVLLTMLSWIQVNLIKHLREWHQNQYDRLTTCLSELYEIEVLVDTWGENPVEGLPDLARGLRAWRERRAQS